MKLYSKILDSLTILLVVLYPVLVTFGKISGDKIIYLLLLVQIIGFLIFKEERKDVFNIIKGLIKDKVFLSLIFLNIAMYMSSLVALDRRIAITNGIRFSMYIFVFYTISYKLKTNRAIDNLRNAFLGVAVISSVVTIFQVIRGGIMGENLSEAHRLSSFIENSNNLGAYTIFSLFIVVMLFINTKNKRFKIIYGISTILLLINIIASQSRNSLIALVIGSVIVAIAYDKRFLIISFIMPIVMLLIPATRARVFQIFDPAQNESRVKIWETAKYMIKDHPVRGLGYENFGVQYEIYVTKYRSQLEVWDGFRAQHPHNIFLKIQAELGIFGTIAFIMFLVATILLLVKGIKSIYDKEIKAIIIGIMAAFIAFQGMNLIDSFYSAPKVIICMFITLGIANNYIRKGNNRPR